MAPKPTLDAWRGGMPGRDDEMPRTRDVALGPDRPERQAILAAFGENVKACRTAAGLSQAVLAQRCFLAPERISSMERGRVSPTLTVLLLLADTIDVPVAELARDLPAPTRQASTEKIRALVAEQPEITTEKLAEALGVPAWYVTQSGHRLRSLRAILTRGRGWEPGQDG
jgi:transcriptional regulator with XRE-family HTH domain